MGSSRKKAQKKADKKAAEQQRLMEQQERARLQTQQQSFESERTRLMSLLTEEQRKQYQASISTQDLLRMQADARQNQLKTDSDAMYGAQAENQRRYEEFYRQQQQSQLEAYNKQLQEFQSATRSQLELIARQSQEQLRAQQEAQGQLLSQITSQFDVQKKAMDEQTKVYQALAGNQEKQLDLLQGEYSRAKSEKIEEQAAATKPVLRQMENQANRNKLLTHLSGLRGRGFNPEYKKSTSNLLR